MFYIMVTAEGIKMLSTNNNDYDHLGREGRVIELYRQCKSTRDIAKELRMSLRDISIILKKHGVNHGLAMIDDDELPLLTSYSRKERSLYKWQSN
jgi:hypothetical protein